MSIKIKFYKYLSIFSLTLLLSIIYLTAMGENNKAPNKNSKFSQACKKALDFYLDRPDLEAEFIRRFDYCKETVKDVSPENLEVNPIISDFKSMYGVNGRTRINVHQGIDIIGSANEPIIAIADGIVLEYGITYCEGPSLVIDHGKSIDNKQLIAIYSHIGDALVKEGDVVKRGTIVAKLPEKIKYPCMARVRHLHLQIGQKYCTKEEKNKWGCGFYIKDLYNSLNPNDYWADGANKVTCFNENKIFTKGTITYPFECKKVSR